MAATTEAAPPPVHDPAPTPSSAPPPVPASASAPQEQPPKESTESAAKTGEEVQVESKDKGKEPESEAAPEGTATAAGAPSVPDVKEVDKEKKALEELRARVEEAIRKNEFVEPPPPPPAKASETKDEAPSQPASGEAAKGGESKGKEPAKEEESEKKETAKAEKLEKKEPVKAEEPEKKDPLKAEEPEKKETPKAEKPERKEPAKAEVPAKKEAAKAEGPEKKEPAKAEGPEKKEPAKAEGREKKEPAKAEGPEKKESTKEKGPEKKDGVVAVLAVEEKPVESKAKDVVAPSVEAKPSVPETVVVAAEKKETKDAVAVAEEKTETREGAVKTEETPKTAAVAGTPSEATAQAKVVAEVEEEKEGAEAVPEAMVDENIELWGVPLLPSKGDERTDVVLMKFLKAREFKVNEAFNMLRETIRWRKRFGVDGILDEDVGMEEDLRGVAFMHGFDREGHPVCYNVYGMFQDKDLYQRVFGDEAKHDKFLRWRVQLLEKGIKDHLSFAPGAINSMVQVTDLKNAPGLGWNIIRQATKQAVTLLQDNYPEFVSTKIFINVPWWYIAFNTMTSPFISQRTKSKFVIARPAKVPEVLFKYIAPEYVPVQYGGLSRDHDTEFNPADGGVTEMTLKAGVKQSVEIEVKEAGSTVVWDVTVVGWEATYEAEFVPSSEGGYTVLIQKCRSVAANEVPIRQSYKAGEAGKIVLTLANNSSRKKKLLYRYKIHCFSAPSTSTSTSV
eukprot:TRINITY_DN3097_c0_g1_i15.p1 TRINITY_DN3097_c0_g1~~TRINITY_DN3097_c0_g1_i15.p1  ORF type:complete len:733 (-),score=142.29 TRINITY_DN3097_c0_g1_i15:654-2852(-)